MSPEPEAKMKVDENNELVAFTVDNWSSWTGSIPSDNDKELCLFSAETIQEEIQKRIDKKKEDLKEVEEVKSHNHSSSSIEGRISELELLRDRFSQSNSTTTDEGDSSD